MELFGFTTVCDLKLAKASQERPLNRIQTAYGQWRRKSRVTY